MESRQIDRSGFDTDGAARVVLACVLATGLFAFVIPAIADATTAALVVMAISLLIRNRAEYWRAPLILAGFWVVFVALCATYATISALPGHHFKGLEKHLPIALGPLAAISLSAACSRLRLKTSIVLILFFSGLIIGALILLIRNDAVSLFAQGWADIDHSFLGQINRNFAALACGLSLIAAASLLHYLFSVKGITSIWTVGVLIALTFVIVFAGNLLILLQSRTAYLATTIGLAVWQGSLIGSAFLRRKTEAYKLKWAIPIVIVAVIAAISAFHFSLIVQRFDNSVRLYLEFTADFVLGRKVKTTSIPVGGDERLQIAAVAIDLIRQRPWFGWGPDASSLLGVFSPLSGIRIFTQFHNGYLQMLVSFGFAGAALMLVLLIVLVWSAFGTRAQTAPPARLSPPLFAAALSLSAYLSISNITESIIFVKPAAMTCMLLAALTCIRSGNADQPKLTNSTPHSSL